MTDDRAFKRAVRRRMEQTGEKYTEARRALRQEGSADLLGGLADREGAIRAIERALRPARPDIRVAAVRFEIGNLADLGETRGTERSDELLGRVAGLLCDHTPEDGTPARLSDAEFVAVLPDHGFVEARPFADWLQASIHRLWMAPQPAADRFDPPPTMIYGVASVPENASDAWGLLAAAEANLQRAKRSDWGWLDSRAAQITTRDPLTGLANVSLFEEELGRALDTERDPGVPVGLVLADLDDFKRVNDAHGHKQGDEVLKAVADVMRAHVGDTGVVARHGGEEFVALLPTANLIRTGEVAESLRGAIEQIRVPRLDGAGDLSVTASCGVASSPQSAVGAESLLNAASAALYEAKRAGKNRVERGWDEIARGPGGMFARFTPQAREVMTLAREVGRRLHHGHIGTEHILLGLLADQGGTAATVLEAQDITADRVGVQLFSTVGLGEGMPSVPPVAPDAKAAIDLAVSAADQLRDKAVTPQHLLLGLLRLDEGAAADILSALGADRAMLEERLLSRLAEDREE